MLADTIRHAKIAVMKIVAISGSPSAGRNSDSMLTHFIEGARSVPGIEIERVFLRDIHIDNFHYDNRMGPLPHEGDFARLCRIIEKEAKGIVIATPTYNFGVPAHLKNFIDRMRFFGLDFSKQNKIGQPVGKLQHLKAYFLVSGGTPNWAEKILFFAFPPFWLRGIFLYHGAHVMGAYYSGDLHTMENKKVLAKCHKKGVVYAKKLLAGKRHGILERIFWRPPQSQ